jgi:DNA-binding transcriptional regulator/RsmH inhibitor MraZ
MLPFCGQDKCSVDKNGRIKLSSRFISDFLEGGSPDIVFRCLPEGAVAVYPENIYLQMRRSESRPAERAAASLVFRRSMRHFGALSHSDRISAQGRVTLPQVYREHGGIVPGGEVFIVGIEIGVEIWSVERWVEELRVVNEHMLQKGEREMAVDLLGADGSNGLE